MHFLRRSLWWICLGCTFVLLTSGYDAIERGRRLRLTVPRLPPPWEKEAPSRRTFRFQVVASGHWSTDRYDYFFLEGEQSLWDGLWDVVWHRVPGSQVRLGLRVRDGLASGTLSIPEQVDGYVFLFPGEVFPGEGAVAWRLAAGSVRLRLTKHGSLATLDATLDPPESKSDFWAKSGGNGCEVRLAAYETPVDIGTALRIFSPVYSLSAMERRYWLAEDPELEDVLPERLYRLAEHAGEKAALPASIEKAIQRRLCHDDYWSYTGYKRDTDLPMRVSLFDGGFHARIDSLDPYATSHLKKRDLWGVIKGADAWVTRDYWEKFGEKMTGAVETTLRLPSQCTPAIEADGDLKRTILEGIVSAARTEFCSVDRAAAPDRFLLADFNVDTPETYVLARGVVYEVPLERSRSEGKRVDVYRLDPISVEKWGSDLSRKIQRRPLRYRLEWAAGVCTVAAEKPTSGPAS
jgi:hypothetical protein